MRALLVVNPRARRGRQLGASVREHLAHLGIETIEDGSLADFDAIVVAGGDGTFSREIPRALALEVPIGLVPLGTFNDLARTLAIPLGVEGACSVIAAGKTRAIDVARVNRADYVTEASIGLSSRITRLQKPADKQRYGLLAIAASVFPALWHARPFTAEIVFDGKLERLKAMQVTVASSPRFGGFITVGDAAIDDGLLDCYAVEIEGLGQFLSVAAAVLSGRRQPGQGLRIFRSAAFEVKTRRPRRVTADGEPAATTPARFEVLPRALRVFVP
ncbi:MAG TPA: YegS/Rv2252/BmrU family lipid kinase [Candidatus Babeliales bacterium]|nr:YegS/Rv2252/BmrU family lipid kinase [Candidatus Babeliales bacterium]